MGNRIYMDHAATTGVAPEVLEAMLPYFGEVYGNASSIHTTGREAAKAVEKARKQVAAAIGAEPREIFFTGSGTESDNLALRGIAEARGNGHLITSAVEHHAVLRTCEKLRQKGFAADILPVDPRGVLHPETVENAVREDTILISVMAANNEIGTVEPIAEIAGIAGEHGIPFHTDAVQAMGDLDIRVKDLHIDLMSISAHKFYGPKGAGALYIREGLRLEPLTTGGMQERKMRPGTENVPAIVGMGAAIEIAARDREANRKQCRRMRDLLISGILDTVPDCRLNGDPENRLSNNCSFTFAGINGEALLLRLDLAGIACSSGSACTAGSVEPSHVLLAIGLTEEEADSSLRLTPGKETTEEEVRETIRTIGEIVRDLREMRFS